MKNRPFVLVAFPLLMITQAVFAQTTCVSRHNQPDGSGGFITGFDCSFYQQNVYPFDLTGYITNGGASLSENALTPGYVIWTSDGTITGTWMDVLDFDANILAGTGSSRVYLFWPGGPSFPSLAGDYLVLPWNPSGVELFDPGDGNHTFTVYDNASTPVAPTISSLSPSSVPAGGPAFTLTVNGSGFLSGATVEWNGSAISSSYVSANQMSALIPANLIASQSSASVTVLNPGAGASIAVTFIVSGASGAGNVQIISHIADGGGWRSTIILVNTDSVPASYSVNFWSDLGAPYLPPLASGTTSGSIPVGGSTTIETADAASDLTEGWAEVTSSQSIGGTAIFRLDTPGQEAAVPLLTSGGVALEIPYQVGNGLALGVALANPSTTQTANITEVIRDQNGNQLSGRTLTLPALNHTAFNPTFPNGLTGSGVVEYVANVSIFALGIRADSGAFTSVDAVYK